MTRSREDYFYPVTLAIVRASAVLEPGAFQLWLALAVHANRDSVAWPSAATLARIVGCERRAVQRRLRMLESAGWIEVVGNRAGGPTSTHYRLTPRVVDDAPPRVTKDAPTRVVSDAPTRVVGDTRGASLVAQTRVVDDARSRSGSRSKEAAAEPPPLLVPNLDPEQQRKAALKAGGAWGEIAQLLRDAPHVSAALALQRLADAQSVRSPVAYVRTVLAEPNPKPTPVPAPAAAEHPLVRAARDRVEAARAAEERVRLDDSTSAEGRSDAVKAWHAAQDALRAASRDVANAEAARRISRPELVPAALRTAAEQAAVDALVPAPLRQAAKVVPIRKPAPKETATEDTIATLDGFMERLATAYEERQK